jgi:serine/threonine-protein kinase
MNAAAARTARRRPTLLVQIAVALGVVGTVPLALAVWQLVVVNREVLFEQLLRTHTVAARTAADAIDSYLDGRLALARALAGDARLVADPTSITAQELLRDSLAAWSESGVAGLALVGADDAVALRVRTKDDAAAVDALLTPPPGEEPRLAAVGGRPWAAVPVPLAGGTGVRLVLIAEASNVARALVPDELGSEAHLLLLDRQGAPLWGAGPGADVLPAGVTAAALSGKLSGAGRFADPSGREIVASWSSAAEGHWIVVSLQPGAIAEAAVRRMARRSTVAVVASLLLVGAISVAAWKGLVRPLRALLSAQRAEAGAAPAEGAPVSETDQLQRTLAELERRAHDRADLGQIFLGRYQVLSLVGSGGMGSVFRGWDPRLQRPVALKTIRLAATDVPEGAASKLLAEAVAVARIAHPNVVAVFDAEESAGAAFVAMELVDGIGLDKYLERRGQLDWREVVPLGAALAHGLAAAHARELVHRDIKPGNVLLGHDGAIKIADFGLATFLSRLHDVPGKVFGTPGFLAPEALRGLPIDERSDLYAMGVVLFRALAGRYPVQGSTFQQLVASTLRDPTPRPEELERVPPDVAALVCELLAKDPARRAAPASGVAERFEAIAQEHHLTWRLDFADTKAGGSGGPGSLSATIPTMRLDADLA